MTKGQVADVSFDCPIPCEVVEIRENGEVVFRVVSPYITVNLELKNEEQ